MNPSERRPRSASTEAAAAELEALARLDGARTVIDAALLGSPLWLRSDVLSELARLVAAGGRWLELAEARV